MTDTLRRPDYTGPAKDPRARVALGVESMSRHMTDEGHQLTEGLHYAGYYLCGRGYGGYPGPGRFDLTNVPAILSSLDPGTVFVQDKREWLGLTADRNRDPSMRFSSVEALRDRPDIFKVGVVKDAQNDRELHVESAFEMGTHAWVVYYHPEAVLAVAPYLRREHLIRTYHTIDADKVPEYLYHDRAGAVVSGALGPAYPLRTRAYGWAVAGELRSVDVLPHPGYHRGGSASGDYLKSLSRYKVAICTASKYGYALRKIIEATAAGCTVVTDLPTWDVLPYIDDNLVRVPSGISAKDLADLLADLYLKYDPDIQRFFSDRARAFYDYRRMGLALTDDIENLRREYTRANELQGGSAQHQRAAQGG